MPHLHDAADSTSARRVLIEPASSCRPTKGHLSSWH